MDEPYIFNCREYLVEGASNAINVDSRVAEIVRKNVVSEPSRYCFDAAEVRINDLGCRSRQLINCCYF